MKQLQENVSTTFNPPLRIFKTSSNGSLSALPASGFERPQLRSLVRHDRIARHFTRRELSFGSPLD